MTRNIAKLYEYILHLQIHTITTLHQPKHLVVCIGKRHGFVTLI